MMSLLTTILTGGDHFRDANKRKKREIEDRLEIAAPYRSLGEGGLRSLDRLEIAALIGQIGDRCAYWRDWRSLR